MPSPLLEALITILRKVESTTRWNKEIVRTCDTDDSTVTKVKTIAGDAVGSVVSESSENFVEVYEC